jgi:Cu(I)/Ag(I) efflux system membrane fusion protein
MTVPRGAVVDTGTQQHVFVAVDDRFEPRPVTVGMQLADRVEIRDGLKEGEQIVAAGVFLLDSESRLRATGGTGGHNHGTPPGVERPAATPGVDPHAGHRQSSADVSAPTADPHARHQTTAAPPLDPHAGHQPASVKDPAGKE